MGTKTITGTVKYPDDSYWVGGIVTITLLESFETSTTFYPAQGVEITLDSGGHFSQAFGVPDTGTAYYEYRGPADDAFKFYLAAGTAVDIVTLRTIANTSAAQDDLQTLLDAAAVLTITNVTSTYQVLATDEYIRADGTFTITLPAATGSGAMYAVKNIGAGTITVDGAGAETIDGAANLTIYADSAFGFIDVAAGAWDAVGG
jgi:hypothetical protein